MPLVVGFDFDMTLADTRPGLKRVWDWLSERTGVPIDSDLVVSRLGPPLEDEVAAWFPIERVPEVVALFRSRYIELAVPPAIPMPGAVEAIAAVRRAGGRVLVVSAKHDEFTKAHVEALGLDADEVIGDLWAAKKGEALLERDATIYVGDHLGDVVAAHTANALSVTVPTGGISAEELRAAGSEVVLTDLTEFADWLEPHVLEQRITDLQAQLRNLGSVMVAFSGGADSAFLLAAAVRALGPDAVVAATAVSPSLPDSEIAPAREFAAGLGVRHFTPTTNEMDRDGYRANAGDRCYFCKSELLDVLSPLADELGIEHVATGTNADDARAGFRPGIRAAFERGAVTPLRDAELTKAQIRTTSREWGLPTWNKPAAACLSSRVAYGIQITPARLARVERAEAGLRTALAEADVPVANLRVRDLGDTAKVEVDSELVEAVANLPGAEAAVRDAGFENVEIDPRGFRSGAMNELLPNPDRYR